MLEINISSLKNNLSAILKKVQKGEEVLVMDRDRPVAKLSSCSHRSSQTSQSLLGDLEKRGIISVAPGKVPSQKWLRSRLVKTKGGVVSLLLQEREESL